MCMANSNIRVNEQTHIKPVGVKYDFKISCMCKLKIVILRVWIGYLYARFTV